MNKATSPLRVGLIGAGHISADYLRATRFFEQQMKVVVCADLNAAAAEARAREFGIEFTSIEALLEDDSIELVLNLTTPQAHVPVGFRAVEAGKHTYCEKPLGLSVAEAEPLLKAARSRGVRVGCAPDTFLGGGQQTARHLIDNGAIGTPIGDVPLLDPKSSKYIKGVGCQWAGKRAIPGIHRRYPDLKLYQTEQECGDSKNDWRYCRYAWTLMKDFLNNGASAYHYWNISLKQGGISRWGWAQNSLVTIDSSARTFKYNYEYYLIKHLSHFVQPGAKRVDTISLTGYENLLAFANPDQSVVVLMQNDLSQELSVRVKAGDKVIAATLQADSFNTFVVRAPISPRSTPISEPTKT